MKNKNILLISLLLIIVILNIGAVIATDTQEINNEKISVEENLDEIDQTSTVNQDIKEKEDTININSNNNDDKKDITQNSNTNSKINSENSDKTVLKNSKYNQTLKSTVTIDGTADNQMNNPTIQNAIDNAKSGDTILITGEEYVHCHFVIDKQLTIVSTVGTKMSPCPGSTVGSGTHGIFYISPQASGTIIQGFTLINDFIDESDSYGILVRGTSNVNIMDCTIINNNGDAIRIEDSTNTLIKNSFIQNSNIGINIIDSEKTSITNNNISSNTITGVYIGLNNKDTTIKENNITSNKQTGIHIISADNIYILNNFIAYNRDGDQSNSKTGAGVYVNCNISKIEIKGNYIKQNGLYGVLNDYRVRNMDASRGAENLEVISDNYFAGHSERVAYHIVYKPYSHGDFKYDAENDLFIKVEPGTGEYDIDKSVVYLGYNYLVGDELACGSTLYEAPSTTWASVNARLKISEITQIKKGVYSVSIVDTNGNVAKDLSSLYITFYLNKNNTKIEPQKGDTYKTVLMKNGVATVSFNKKDYQSTDNILTACFPGVFNDYIFNDYKTLNILDSDIPEDIKEDNDTSDDKNKNNDDKTKINTKITVSNIKTTPNSGEYFTAKLTDNTGKPLVNKILILKLNSKTYNIKTDETGTVKLKINLNNQKTYELTLNFDGDEQYNKANSKAKIVIKKLSQKITSKNQVFAPKTNNYYLLTLKDGNNRIITNKNIKFTINGKTYTVKTNSKGVAKLKIKLSKKKTYKIKINSPTTNKYTAVTKTNEITIKTLKQKIISSNKKFAPKTNNYYTITLKDQNNKLISKKKITIKIGKKTYKKTTNKNGIVKIKINYSKAKTYKIKINSPSTSKYKSKTKTSKIIISKFKQKITSSNKKYLPQSGEYYTITLKDENNKLITKKSVKFTINSKTYTVKTNTKGIAKLKISLTNEKVYTLKINSPATKQYKALTKTNKITIEKGTPELISRNRTFAKNMNNEYNIYLKDYNGKALANGKIEFKINSRTYSTNTDSNGLAKVSINLAEAKQYQLIINFLGDIKNKAITKTNTITVKDAYNTHFIDNDFSNDEIQKLISESPENSNIEFLGSNYEGINLNINKALNIYSNIGTRLNGLSGQPVIKINSDNINLSNFNIIANSVNGESDAILVNNANNVNISNNNISNSLDSSKINNYDDGSVILPGTGIKILNSKNIAVINNKINSFESGIYNEYSQNLVIIENLIKSNNYGIKYGFGSSNTKIFNNTITNNIGWYVMDAPEGPRGYGIFLNNSAVNITINQNNISNNYMGISIDANKSTGIVITSNFIADNSLEGIRFNAGYDLADDVVEPNVSDNAIYRNAKGPSMMILGEMSANPYGIYGAGQKDENLKLKIGSNWYGVNTLRIWDNDSGIVGVGTMCPRIKANTTAFKDIESNIPGTYSIKFYKNNDKLATNLATFDLYATLNRGTNKQTEVKFNVVNGTAIFSFDKKYYLDSDNKIEISVGSLINGVDRIYTVVFDYNVPDAEIPL